MESAGQVLTGAILLHHQAFRFTDQIRLRLLAIIEVSKNTGPMWYKLQKYFRNSKMRSIETVSEQCMPAHDSLLSPSKNYELPFELWLRSDLTETIQGIPEMCIKYRVEATTTRGDMDILRTHRAIRVIRTPALTALRPLQSESSEGTWDRKVRYSFGIFPRAASFGSTIQLNICAYPLVAGLELKNIEAKIIETREVLWRGCPIRGKKVSKCIAEYVTNTAKHSLEEQHRGKGSASNSWKWIISLLLPRRLGDCVQSLSHNLVRVYHQSEVTIVVKGPNEYTSTIKVLMPVSIYMPLDAYFDTRGILLNPWILPAINEPASSIAPPGYSEQDRQRPEPSYMDYQGKM